jgi:hypothetical protein
MVTDRPVRRRVIGMRGLFRFLLGSILGAALGILIAERRQRKAARPRGLPVFEGAGGPELASSRVQQEVPPPTVKAEESRAVTTEEPATMGAEEEPVMQPTMVAESEIAEAELVVSEAAEPQAAASEEAEFPSAAPEEAEFEAAEPEAAEPVIGEAMMVEPDLGEIDYGLEVVVAPELLEEPIPGTGWQSSLEPLGEEDVEEPFVIPVEKEAVAPERPGTFGQQPSNGSKAVADAAAGVSPDDLRARIEETRRRIRMELDQPFFSDAERTRFSTSATTKPATRESQSEGESAEQVSDGGEEAPISEFGMGKEIASEDERPVGELDGPSRQPIAARDAVGTVGAASAHPTAGVPVDEELTAEYDAIKARIQETRSRLKAKAFDAMMTGESALLGRDSGDRALNRPEAPKIDEEVEQSIERGLREEEG